MERFFMEWDFKQFTINQLLFIIEQKYDILHIFIYLMRKDLKLLVL